MTLPQQHVDKRCPSEQPESEYNHAAGPWYALACHVANIVERGESDDLDAASETAVLALYDAARFLRDRLSAAYPTETEDEPRDLAAARGFAERCGFTEVAGMTFATNPNNC